MDLFKRMLFIMILFVSKLKTALMLTLNQMVDFM